MPEETKGFIAALPCDVSWHDPFESLAGLNNAGLPLTMYGSGDEIERRIPEQHQQHGRHSRSCQQQREGAANAQRALEIEAKLTGHGLADNQAGVGTAFSMKGNGVIDRSPPLTQRA